MGRMLKTFSMDDVETKISESLEKWQYSLKIKGKDDFLISWRTLQYNLNIL